MPRQDTKQHWVAYKETEIRRLIPVLHTLGYKLSATQPHTEGERYLMSGKKLVLLGTRMQDGLPVVIKASSTQSGIREITAERRSRHVLARLRFAYSTFTAPEELYFGTQSGILLFITAFIPQDTPFIARPIEEQFRLALASLKTQEGVHATTHGHLREIRGLFPFWAAATYLESFADFKKSIGKQYPTLKPLFEEAEQFLTKHREDIERYCGFLTHSDFVPHNFRVHKNTTYLLDYSSIHFGNKHESWARFLNFMTLYNPKLERWFVAYVKENRSEEEQLSLKLMRIYKLGFLIAFYAEHREVTEGNLQKLTEARIAFWSDALKAQLQDNPLSEERVANYTQERDSLRTTEEKRRQENLH